MKMCGDAHLVEYWINWIELCFQYCSKTHHYLSSGDTMFICDRQHIVWIPWFPPLDVHTCIILSIWADLWGIPVLQLIIFYSKGKGLLQMACRSHMCWLWVIHKRRLPWMGSLQSDGQCHLQELIMQTWPTISEVNPPITTKHSL